MKLCDGRTYQVPSDIWCPILGRFLAFTVTIEDENLVVDMKGFKTEKSASDAYAVMHPKPATALYKLNLVRGCYELAQEMDYSKK